MIWYDIRKQGTGDAEEEEDVRNTEGPDGWPSIQVSVRANPALHRSVVRPLIVSLQLASITIQEGDCFLDAVHQSVHEAYSNSV